MARTPVSLPSISADRRGIRRLARSACPAGVVWVRDADHPEAARSDVLPFIFAAGRLRKQLDPFAAQRPSGGAQRAVREIDVLVAALLADNPDTTADDARGAAGSYASWVLAHVPTTHARLRGLALAGWWPNRRAVA